MSRRLFNDLKVLVADDQGFIRNLVRGMLFRLGISNIYSAADGEEAIKILRERGSGIGCIISDWNMAPIDGLELLRAVRTGALGDVRATTPFILLTGHSVSTVVTAALNLDVSAYLVKPASAAKLEAALLAALQKPCPLKPPHVYEVVEGIPLPGTASETPASDSWAGWIKKGQPAFQKQLTSFVRRGSLQLKETPADEISRIRNIRLKRSERIKPGAVLVEDYCDLSGSVLIAAGTVLNDRLLQRVKALETKQGEAVRLWVGQRD